MTLGAEPKKVVVLIVLGAVAVIVLWVNVFSSADVPAAPARPAVSRPAAPAVGASAPPQNAIVNRTSRTRALQEFRPSLKPKKPEDRPDPMAIDPTLRLDLLAKLQKVTVEGNHRNLFDMGQAPPPKGAAQDKDKSKTPAPSPILPAPAATAPVTPAAPPPPPKIPLKFYGYVNPSAQPGKRAFFLDGEDVHVVTEGEIVKRRYKIVRIGINSVVVEDTENKNQQTIPLEETPG
ncbi:MAG TPA: hypothetical protein VMZ52_02895 [Bryobacteraceae bacterium]|nr:hypothetical protein [Bryobacteraceae bacterium]